MHTPRITPVQLHPAPYKNSPSSNLCMCPTTHFCILHRYMNMGATHPRSQTHGARTKDTVALRWFRVELCDPGYIIFPLGNPVSLSPYGQVQMTPCMRVFYNLLRMNDCYYFHYTQPLSLPFPLYFFYTHCEEAIYFTQYFAQYQILLFLLLPHCFLLYIHWGYSGQHNKGDTSLESYCTLSEMIRETSRGVQGPACTASPVSSQLRIQERQWHKRECYVVGLADVTMGFLFPANQRGFYGTLTSTPLDLEAK